MAMQRFIPEHKSEIPLTQIKAEILEKIQNLERRFDQDEENTFSTYKMEVVIELINYAKEILDADFETSSPAKILANLPRAIIGTSINRFAIVNDLLGSVDVWDPVFLGMVNSKVEQHAPQITSTLRNKVGLRAMVELDNYLSGALDFTALMLISRAVASGGVAIVLAPIFMFSAAFLDRHVDFLNKLLKGNMETLEALTSYAFNARSEFSMFINNMSWEYAEDIAYSMVANARNFCWSHYIILRDYCRGVYSEPLEQVENLRAPVMEVKALPPPAPIKKLALAESKIITPEAEIKEVLPVVMLDYSLRQIAELKLEELENREAAFNDVFNFMLKEVDVGLALKISQSNQSNLHNHYPFAMGALQRCVDVIKENKHEVVLENSNNIFLKIIVLSDIKNRYADTISFLLAEKLLALNPVLILKLKTIFDFTPADQYFKFSPEEKLARQMRMLRLLVTAKIKVLIDEFSKKIKNPAGITATERAKNQSSFIAQRAQLENLLKSLIKIKDISNYRDNIKAHLKDEKLCDELIKFISELTKVAEERRQVKRVA